VTFAHSFFIQTFSSLKVVLYFNKIQTLRAPKNVPTPIRRAQVHIPAECSTQNKQANINCFVEVCL
jgi:hypothetical protein